jgi:hypothetical protein
MQRRIPWRSAAAAASLVLLASCGGELIALLGFLGSAGGDWLQDDQPAENPGQVGLQLRSNCGAGNNQACTINIQPDGAQDLYATNFNLTFTSNLPGCVPNGNGTASGRRLLLTGCFTGNYVTINQALSDDGLVRMFFNFVPPLPQGVWTEIQSGQRRFAFSSNTVGCELGNPAVPVDVVISAADIQNPAGPFETTITSFTVQGSAPWQGVFVGISGMRLTRGTEVMELERRDSPDTCP